MLKNSYDKLRNELGHMLPKRMWFHAPCKSFWFPWGTESRDCDKKFKGRVAKINYSCSSRRNSPGYYFGATLEIYGFTRTYNHIVEAWGHRNATARTVPIEAVHPLVEVRFEDFRVLVPREPAVWFQHTRSSRFPEPCLLYTSPSPRD